MLQQTQAPRVVDAFGRWVGQFPDPPSCAQAGPAAVLRAWEGLGYNRRALNLHRAAVVITDEHGGRVPRERAALEALPGVGPYTARAVLAFAFDADVGVVDVNVARVLGRAVAGRRLAPREAQQLADRVVPSGRAWDYNQTMFDIGATYCRARDPRCGGCPLRRRCTWTLSGRTPPDPGDRGRRQSRFSGSDRQGRGRLVNALRRGPIPHAALATTAGWPDDEERVLLVAEGLVRDGLAVWSQSGGLQLP
jgi:A/G-specific adenine glycosylase